MANENIKAKIEKLLALAGNNPNEQEAQSALIMAQKLMARYEIERNELNGTDAENVEYTMVDTGVRAGGFVNSLAATVADALGCMVFVNGFKKICFFHRKGQVEAMADCLKFAYKAMNKNWREYMKAGHVVNVSAERNSFYQGWVLGLKEQTDKQCKMLAIVVPADVKQAAQQLHTEKSRKSRVRVSANDNAYNAGYETGREYGKAAGIHA